MAAQAAAVQQQFVQNLKTSAVSYASVEDAIASFLQGLTASADSFVNTLGDWLNQQLLQLQELLPIILFYSIYGGFWGIVFAFALPNYLGGELQLLLGEFGSKRCPTPGDPDGLPLARRIATGHFAGTGKRRHQLLRGWKAQAR